MRHRAADHLQEEAGGAVGVSQFEFAGSFAVDQVGGDGIAHFADALLIELAGKLRKLRRKTENDAVEANTCGRQQVVDEILADAAQALLGRGV